MFCQARLVELQSRRLEFRKHGIAMFAILSDRVSALRDFAEHHGIDFPLLSDEWGRAARSLGVLDEHVRQHNAEAGILVPQAQLDDVAYPCTFLLDGDGIVRERRLPADIRLQESTASILEEGFGIEAEPVIAVQEVRAQGISIRAWTDVASYRLWLRFRLKMTISMVHGQAVAPIDAALPFRIELADRKGLQAGPASLMSRAHGLRPGEMGMCTEYQVAMPLVFTEDTGASSLDVVVRCCQQASSAEALPLTVPVQPRII